MSSPPASPTTPSIPTLWRAAGRGIAALFANAPAGRIVEHQGSSSEAVFILSGEPIADLNYAFLHDGADAIDTVDAYQELLCTAGGEYPLPGLIFTPHPITLTLQSYLANQGWRETPDMSLMVCDLTAPAPNAEPSAPPAPPFMPTRVRSVETLRESLRVTSLSFPIPYDSLLRAFGKTLIANPNLAQFMTTLHGEPITVLQLAGEDGLVGVWSMATLPSHQRQGGGSATLRYALDYARSVGYAHAYLIATAAGLPLYAQFGFRTVARCGVWVRE